MSNEKRNVMNKKPVLEIEARSVINFKSAFEEKLLCDGPTFSTGMACAFSCSYCYVAGMFNRTPGDSPYNQAMKELGLEHERTVVRRKDALQTLVRQLTDAKGRPKFKADPNDRRVIYSSPLVDVAANMELVAETVDCCKAILALTHWQIRLLSKSPLLVKVAILLHRMVEFDPACGFTHEEVDRRMIYGLSTGTLDDRVARAIEPDVPLASKRVAALRELQDNGFRTFAMVCPSLPQKDYLQFAIDMKEALRYEKCEHVWAEVINVRGQSFVRTQSALLAAGLEAEAELLASVSGAGSSEAWENYARRTFSAHAFVMNFMQGKLRFLQYVTPASLGWWSCPSYGHQAVLLGRAVKK